MGTRVTEARVRQCREAGLWRNESLETYLDRWATEPAGEDLAIVGQDFLGHPIDRHGGQELFGVAVRPVR